MLVNVNEAELNNEPLKYFSWNINDVSYGHYKYKIYFNTS